MNFIRDPRPVWQQVLSGLKISAVLLAIGAALLIGWLNIPRYRIAAFIWHLRHGNVIEVGQYRVPVPREWYVYDLSDHDVFLVNLNTGDTIFADKTLLLKNFTLSGWFDVETRFSATGDLKITGRRDLQIGGENFLCLEQDFDLKIAHTYPIQCRSDGGLEVDFQPYIKGKAHHRAFYSLLQQIQKL